jgi:hypothetical protein
MGGKRWDISLLAGSNADRRERAEQVNLTRR